MQARNIKLTHPAGVCISKLSCEALLSATCFWRTLVSITGLRHSTAGDLTKLGARKRQHDGYSFISQQIITQRRVIKHPHVCDADIARR